MSASQVTEHMVNYAALWTIAPHSCLPGICWNRCGLSDIMRIVLARSLCVLASAWHLQAIVRDLFRPQDEGERPGSRLPGAGCGAFRDGGAPCLPERCGLCERRSRRPRPLRRSADLARARETAVLRLAPPAGCRRPWPYAPPAGAGSYSGAMGWNFLTCSAKCLRRLGSSSLAPPPAVSKSRAAILPAVVSEAGFLISLKSG